jgi:hypothetical protein
VSTCPVHDDVGLSAGVVRQGLSFGAYGRDTKE